MWMGPRTHEDAARESLSWNASENWITDLQHDMVGVSGKIHGVLALVKRVARTGSTVLIQGETGTGKELVARAIHRNSPRATGPFVAINCAALTESLLESEMFGHEKGAFTGAIAQKKGKIEIAAGGTLFLDEISELAPGMQAKLLRVLQEREVEPVGSTRSIKVDVRIIAATNCDLRNAVHTGRFREDVYFRLNVVTITAPPLRERREDVCPLAASFIAKISARYQVPEKAVSLEALSLLMRYEWPGNVRELENAMEHAVVLSKGLEITSEDLPRSLQTAVPADHFEPTYSSAVKENKRQLIVHALEQAKGSYVEAARILGLHPNSLLRLIRKLGLKSSSSNALPPETA